MRLLTVLVMLAAIPAIAAEPVTGSPFWQMMRALARG
jgi:hypothetical protein